MKRASSSVFVGNIPFEMTEEQLIDIFKEVGRVKSFRLVFDRDSGKPKGYGFCEYLDAETASSAVRNLNGYDVGGRMLRVDYADNEGTGGTIQFNQDSHHSPAMTNPNILATDAITELLASYSIPELLEVLKAMKQKIQTNPAEVSKQLADNPQLGYAIFQSMLITNLVPPSAIQQLMQPTSAPPSNQQDAELEQQKALIYQVMNMTQQQIDMLPPDQKQQIMMLKAQLAQR